MKNIFLLTLISLSIGGQLYAQGAKVRNNYAWSIGLHAGGTSYYGDLNHNFFLPNRNDLLSINKNYDSKAAGIVVEKRISSALGLSVTGTYGNVTGNDRAYNWGGKLITDNPTLARSLNFRTEFYDLSAALTYNFANGFLIRNNARFSPFLSAGVGLTNFDVYGDLYTAEGNRYYYWADNTVRNLMENDPDAATAVEIQQDKQYETRLSSEYKIEGKDYATRFVLNVPVTLGVKYRMADHWDLSLFATARYMFTDYFDDVSGGPYPPTGEMNAQQQYILNPNARNWLYSDHETRGNANGLNDVVGYVGIGINYRLGMQIRKFKGPRFYTQETTQAPYVAPTAPVTSGNQPVNVNISASDNYNLLQTQLREIQNLQGENSRLQTEKLMAEMRELEAMKNKMELASPVPIDNNPEIMARMRLLEMRMDSVREAEIADEDVRIKDLSMRIAKLESSTDTTGVGKLKAERRTAQNKKDKLRKQKKSSNAELTGIQARLEAMNNKVDSLNRLQEMELKDELATMRAQMTAMKTEMEKLKTQQPVQIYNSVPQQQPQQVVTQQPAQPIIVQAPQNQAANNDQLNLILNQINRNLENMSARLTALENKPAATVQTPAAPVIVNTPPPAPVVPAPVINQTTVVSLGLSKVSVFFGNGSANVATQYRNVLNDIAREANKDNRIVISLNGYASTTGSTAANQKLSEARCENVRKYLVSRGVSPANIFVQAYGSGSSSSAGESDRRVDVELISK